jgi:chromosome segregation protein
MAHLLKKMELNGFKSFGQRTTFDFGHGIIGIVGPNGSGKSNVIDGIRWLLGEREAKNLRGGKGEDLIFAGTPQRPRVGQAQASLHFENINNFFPVEFSEVVVTRQVNRDGSNQYFINKAEVRLKDLIDFFAQARLGARGFVVVTQGNSDMFIQASPSVRREMIEEMLGLREYQLKKEEAERRLKNTQVNLDKVHALVEEILPHLRSLKRQTNRWEKRGLLEEELKTLENHFFGAEYKELSGKLAGVRDDIARHAHELGELRHRKEAAENHLRSVEASQPEERKELTIIKEDTQALLGKRSELQKEIGRLEAQLEIGERAAAPASPEAKQLHALVKNIKARLEVALEDPDSYEKIINQILEEIDDTLREAPAGPAKAPVAPDLKARFDKIHADLTAIERQIQELKTKEQQLEKNQEQFYLAFKQAVAAVEQAKDEIERWETRNREREFERERLELRKAEWDRQVAQAGREEKDFAQVELPAELPSRAELEHRIFKLRGDLASIGEIDQALLKEAQETEKRYEFLNKETEDLDKAKNDLRRMIGELNDKIKGEFDAALGKINTEFDKFFGLMFGGGQAKLKLETPKPRKTEIAEGEMPEAEVKDEVKTEDEAEAPAGIEISVSLPRKRISSLGMLSGGERSLVGIAALFALVSVSPPPFLVLDEVDAPLDERNARRFAEMLKEFSKHTQFILVTHNRATMEAADILYGVTMDQDGTSKVVSLKLEAEPA